MVEHVAETITRYNMLPFGSKVAVAVSGGPDSVCLLHVLKELAPRFCLTLSVAHLNHRLRGDASDADAEFVAHLAESLGLKPYIRFAEIGSSNIEEAGREARLAFFRSLEVDRVATGHTLSDQAETVLMRVIRGTGITGLRGILPVTEDGRVRPLIHCSRAEVNRFLDIRKLPYRTDASNCDQRFTRNRIRHEIISRLRRENPEVEETLARLASFSADEEDHWALVVKESNLAGQVVSVQDLAAHPVALVRRVVRESIRQTTGNLRRIEADHVEKVLGLVYRPDGRGSANLPGLRVTRSQNWLRFVKNGTAPGTTFTTEVHPPGTWDIGRGEAVHLELIEIAGTKPQNGYTEGGHLLDASAVAERLLLRSWRPGDRIRLPGHGERKLKTIFQRERVPIWERAGWPVLEFENRIVWTKRFGVAEGFAVKPASSRALSIAVRPVVSSA